ncbi:Psoralen synthase (Fragment) [Seminavis robusta]|uniref:Psoralen synthase n=1 Tax=Seminavis robusta TaxID=568900 RepID=A0A9N8ERR6_9STRA
MVLSSLLPEKKSPIAGIPVIPGGTLWGGHLHLLQEPDFRQALHNWTVAHADDHGRCTFYMGPTTPSLSVTHCDDVQHLLKASAHRNAFPLMRTHFEQLFGKNTVGLANGKEWKQQRSRITKALHSTAVVQHHERAFTETTQRFVKQLLFANDTTTSLECPDLVPLMKALTMDCFGQAAFHVDFKTCQQLMQKQNDNDNNNTGSVAIGPAFEALTTDLMRRMSKDVLVPTSHVYSLPTAANQTYAHEKEKVLNFLLDIIRKRQELMKQQDKDVPADLLSGFLEHFSTEVDGNDANHNEQELALIIAQSILGLLFAGYETSSVTMSYTLHQLSQHPEVLDKCLEEIKQVQKNDNDDNNNPHTSTTIDTPFVYLEAVVKETLRLYPPAISTTRTAERDFELPAIPGGTLDDKDKIHVPKGTYLYVPIWIIQRDPKHFDHPNEFRPERWVTRNNASEWQPRSDVNAKAWIPFSAGARACPGQRFAMQEMITILSTLLPLVTLKAPDDYVLEPHRDGFVQVPKGGVPMTLGKR